MAMAHAALNQSETVCIDDVLAACRTLNRQMLDTLAARLDVFGTWDQLVTSEMMAAKLSGWSLKPSSWTRTVWMLLWCWPI